ncbi:MAG: glycosyltransferase, partial [Alphaproteobacteria bacterium]|nr:glycosyltransferase [Alphaproteobacteria bacterium]
MRDVFFAIPGDLTTLTGGYIYARRLIDELPALGWHPIVVPLPASYPYPTAVDLGRTRDALAQLPAGAVVVIDGLAFGAMPTSVIEGLALRVVALVHHPLALETGLTPEQTAAFRIAEQLALSRAKSVVVTSPQTAKALERDYAVPGSRITIALPGTDPAP